MAPAYSDDDIRRMTVVQLMSYLTDRKVTLPSTRGLKQMYVDMALEEVRKERAGIRPPPEPKAASRMQSPQKTVPSDTSAERPLLDSSDAVEPSRDANAEEPPVVLLPLPTPPPTAVSSVGKGVLLAIGLALIAIAIGAIFRFVYDQPEPEPTTYLEMLHAKILELLTYVEKRLLQPAMEKLHLSNS